MTPTAHRSTRIALSAAASLAAVGALTGCGGSSPAAADTPQDARPGPAGTSATDDADGTGSSRSAGSGSAGAGDYADGTYEATGNYVSPGGKQQVAVSLTLADGVVTAVIVTPEAVDPRSQGFQEQFASGIDGVVVGVPLDELAVDKVSGSSLTSRGFADAVEQIKAEALA